MLNALPLRSLSASPASRVDRMIGNFSSINAIFTLLLGWHFNQLALASIACLALLAATQASLHLPMLAQQARQFLISSITALIAVVQGYVSGAAEEVLLGSFIVLTALLAYRDWKPIVVASCTMTLCFLLILTHGPLAALSYRDWSAPLFFLYLAIQTAMEILLVLRLARHMSELNETRELLKQTLEQTVDAVVVINEHNQVTLFNAAAERLWETGREQVLGENVRMLVPTPDREPHDDYVQANRETGNNKIVGTSREVRIAVQDVSTKWASMSISKIEVNSRILYSAFLRDVTRLREERQHMELLSMAVHGSDVPIIVTGADRRVVFVNDGCIRLLGYAADELVGRHPIDIFSGPHTDPHAMNAIRQHAMAGEDHIGEVLIYAKNRQPVWVSAVINAVRDKDGEMTHFVAVLGDITHAKLHEVLEHRGLDAIAREVSLLEVMTLICQEVELLSPEVTASIFSVDMKSQLRALAGPSMPAHYLASLDGLSIGPKVGACGTAAFRAGAVVTCDIETDELWHDYKDMALACGFRACWAVPIVGSAHKVLGVITFYFREKRAPSDFHRRLVDVSVHLCTLALERENSQAYIHQLANYDPLTHLPNREFVYNRASRMINEMRENGQALALFVIHLDRLERINELYGHEIRDVVLRSICSRVELIARPEDLIGRIGEGEFVVLQRRSDIDLAERTARRLCDELAASIPIPQHDRRLHPDINVGVALFPSDGQSIQDLIRNANVAMHSAKRLAPGKFQFFSAHMNLAVQERASLEAELRRAIELGGLSLDYQPQINLEDSTLYGVEALLRWEHAEKGPISPARFVPLAEECGLIIALGNWVLREACRQMQQWIEQGIYVPHISVNISAKQLQDEQFAAFLEDMLAEHHLSPSQLVVELTESVMLEPTSDVAQTLDTLRKNGIRLSMDDFGTGYSSLSYLHRLPIQELKLDKSFIQDIDHNLTARSLTTAVLSIGQALGLVVVAEGVETDEQLAFLRKSHCPIGQGYLIARPMTASSLENWLERNKK